MITNPKEYVIFILKNIAVIMVCIFGLIVLMLKEQYILVTSLLLLFTIYVIYVVHNAKEK